MADWCSPRLTENAASSILSKSSRLTSGGDAARDTDSRREGG
jgi:hypothetical protein